MGGLEEMKTIAAGRFARGSRVACGALLFVAAFAPGLLAAPASAGLTKKIDALFAKWDRMDSPGVIVAIAKDGETIHARGYGMANLEHSIPLTPETVSESGSVAKQFTAAAVVLLAQRGKLSLEDPVRKHLPELPAALADPITVRMLLNHTSGLRDIHGLFELIGRPSYSSMHTNEEVLQVMSRQRDLNFKPGTDYLYCNASYILAAVIVQRASGKSFAVFCRDELFRPHGMAQTRWRDDFTAIVPGRAAGYEPRPSGGYRIDTPYSNLVGNGGLLTTVGDLLKWNASFERATGEWAEVVRALQTPAKLSDGRVLNYGLGLTIDDYAGLQEISHGGATSGYRTFLARFPERGLSFALLGNDANFNPAPAARAVARAVLDLPAPGRAAAVAIPRDVVATHAGLYHSPQTDAFVTLTARDGKLFDGAVELIPTAAGVFSNASATHAFKFDAAAPGRMVATTPTGEVKYGRVTKAQPSAAQLAAYAGSYYSEELDVGHTLAVRGGKIASSRWPGPWLPGTPTFADGFWFGGWHATFTRDANGNVTGYELTNAGGRCRRIRFTRR